MLRTNKGLCFSLGLALFLAFQPAVYALAVSDIQLNSHLNQPLDAEIMLLSATPEEIENLSLEIKRLDEAGTTLYRWPGVMIEISTNNAGKHYLHIKSKQPVTEPVVSFILELNWSNGHLKREYVLLIDPQLG